MKDEYIRREDAIRLAEQGQVQGFPWQFQMLVRLPPADVVPVRHARWRHYEGMYACEDCGAQLDDESPFCPMCGAKMDGECRER